MHRTIRLATLIALLASLLAVPASQAAAASPEALARAVSIPVIASGGVSSLADLKALKETGVIEGAISGRALYDGAIDLPEALKALRG